MTVGAQIYEIIYKNPGITAPEIIVLFDKNPSHIYNELGALESTRKITGKDSFIISISSSLKESFFAITNGRELIVHIKTCIS